MATRPHALDEALLAPDVAQDPYPLYARLRDEGVWYSEVHGGWLVSRHADVKTALRDPARLSNFGWEARYLARLPEATRARIPELFEHFATPGLINADPPLHTRLRRLVGGIFVPRAVARIADHVAEVVDELLAAAPDELDVIRDLAAELPTIIIAELFGAPRADRRRFRAWSSDLTSFFATPDPLPERADRANASLAEFRTYLRALAAERRARPTDDVIGTLVAAGEGEDGLTENEVLATCVIFLIAGHETTTNLIANTVLALLRRPEELAAARRDDEAVRLAVEETLRFDGPIQRIRRMAVEDLELAGRPVRAGDPVFLLLGAANRDPAVFHEPDAFRPGREDGPHMAFGHGIHFCLGAALARLEAPVAVAALLRARPELALVDGWEPAYVPSPTFRALTALPVRTS
jgi:cytochrome P450